MKVKTLRFKDSKENIPSPLSSEDRAVITGLIHLPNDEKWRKKGLMEKYYQGLGYK